MRKTSPKIRKELHQMYVGYSDMIDTAVEQMKLYSIKKMPSCANELIDRNLSICYPIIVACSDYPYFRHNNKY